MRVICNVAGEVCELCGFKDMAYRLYLAGFRYKNR